MEQTSDDNILPLMSMDDVKGEKENRQGKTKQTSNGDECYFDAIHHQSTNFTSFSIDWSSTWIKVWVRIRLSLRSCIPGQTNIPQVEQFVFNPEWWEYSPKVCIRCCLTWEWNWLMSVSARRWRFRKDTGPCKSIHLEHHFHADVLTETPRKWMSSKRFNHWSLISFALYVNCSTDILKWRYGSIFSLSLLVVCKDKIYWCSIDARMRNAMTQIAS